MQKKKENAYQGDSDEEFILWLYQEFYRLMFFIAQKYVSDQTWQEEIVQESLRKLIEKTNHLRHFQRPVLASYIVSTVRNTSIDLLKSLQEEESRIVNLDDRLTQEFSESRAVEEGLILQEEIEQFKIIWKELDTETKTLLEGKYILEYNSEKLSRLLKCKPNSVRMKLTRARRKALELMRKRGGTVMTSHERLVENYEDALFALLMDSVAEEEGAEALRLNEELKKAPSAEVPKAVRDRCEKTIRTAFAKKRLRITGRTAARWFTKVAVIATLCGLMFMVVFAASEDIRIATLNVLIQVLDDRTEITFTGNASEGSIDNHKTANREYPYHIAVDRIPSGFAFQNGQTDAAVDVVRYVGPDDGSILITFTPYQSSTVYNVNSEGCETKDVIVQGKPATLYITKADMLNERFGEDSTIWSDITICWIDEINGNIAEISATNLTEEEVLRLADGVHWLN